DDLSRLAVSAQRRHEEPSCSVGVAPWGDVDVDDLAVLVDRPVDVAPPSSDPDIDLVDVPTVSDAVPARSSGIDEQWGEALHPAEHGDVIDFNAALAQELFDVAVGEPKPFTTALRAHGEPA